MVTTVSESNGIPLNIEGENICSVYKISTYIEGNLGLNKIEKYNISPIFQWLFD